jgi:hypothetical protein
MTQPRMLPGKAERGIALPRALSRVTLLPCSLFAIRYSLLPSTCQEPSTTGWTSVPGERIFAGRLARAVHPDCTFSPE